MDDFLCAIQQCTECGEHRAKIVDDCEVVGLPNQEPNENSDVPDPDDGDGGGSVWRNPGGDGRDLDDERF